MDTFIQKCASQQIAMARIRHSEKTGVVRRGEPDVRFARLPGGCILPVEQTDRSGWGRASADNRRCCSTRISVSDLLPAGRLKALRGPLNEFELVASSVEHLKKAHNLRLVYDDLALKLLERHAGTFA